MTLLHLEGLKVHCSTHGKHKNDKALSLPQDYFPAILGGFISQLQSNLGTWQPKMFTRSGEDPTVRNTAQASHSPQNNLFVKKPAELTVLENQLGRRGIFLLKHCVCFLNIGDKIVPKFLKLATSCNNTCTNS